MAVVQSSGRLTAIHQTSMPRIIRHLDTPLEVGPGDYSTIWRTQPNVRLVVDFLARNIAQLGLHLYRKLDQSDRERADQHPAASPIYTPNPYTTRYRFVFQLVSDLAVFANHISVKMARADGRVGLFRLPPTNVYPSDDSTWFEPAGYVVRGNRGEATLRPEQVVHIRGADLESSFWGVPPLESLRVVIAEDMAAATYREKFWKNAARFEGVLERPPEAPGWSKEARERFRAEWQAMYAGAGGSGKTAILEEGMTFKPMSWSAKDSQYLEARKLTRQEVAAAFHISPAMVGILEHANFANIDMQHQMLYQDTLGPWLKMIEEDLALQLLPDFEDTENLYFEFNIHEKLKGSFKDQAEALNQAVGRPWMTADEARGRLNLPSMGGSAEELAAPLNMQFGETAESDVSPEKITALRTLIQAGFDPAAVARMLGFDLPHLGDVLPVTLRPLEEMEPLPPVEVEKARHMKARPERWVNHEKQHEQALTKFFERQQDAIVKRLGAGQALPAAFDPDRWNGELQADLFRLAMATAGDIGGEVAERFGGAWTNEQTTNYLAEGSRVAAEEINRTTYDELKSVLRDSKSYRKQDEEEEESPVSLARGVFAVILASRAPQIALTRVTSVANFARHDAAKASGVRRKKWIVTNPKSRHPQMNGEIVPLGQPFSNGLAWPGDSSGGADETAGCQCILDMEA